MKIDRNTKIGELLARHPEAAAVLYERGFGCLGCQFAAYETLGEGAAAHGMSGKETKKLIEEIKKAAAKRRRKESRD